MTQFLLTLRTSFLISALISVFFTLGCVSQQHPGPVADKQEWAGRISGMAEGDLTLLVSKIQSQDSYDTVSGHFALKLEKTSGYGDGIVKCRLKGEIREGILEAKIWGRADVSYGSTVVSGNLNGSMAAKEGFGNWLLRHEGGYHSGEWVAQKTSE